MGNDESDREPFVEPDYVDRLLWEAGKIGIDDVELCRRAGYDKGKPRRGYGAVFRIKRYEVRTAMALRLRAVIVDGGGHPPPLVFGERDLVQWAYDGAVLEHAAPGFFREKLAEARDMAGRLGAYKPKPPRETELDLGDAFFREVRSDAKPQALPQPPIKNDGAGRYDGSHGQKNKGPLDPPRKPPPRARRRPAR